MNIQNDTYYQIVNSMTFPLVIINLQKKITIINISGEDFLKQVLKWWLEKILEISCHSHHQLLI